MAECRFNLWVLLWAFSYAVVTVVLGSEVVSPGATAWALAVLPIPLGIGTIWSYVRFLRGADELLRKIQLEALAIGFGVGVVFMMGYRLLEHAGAPEIDTSDPILVMVIALAVGQWLGQRRYS